MARWLAWFGLVLVVCGAIFATRSTDSQLLEDTDTVALIVAIRATDDPMAWFRGDWPLRNQFYRPVSTLAFEMDNALYANSASGYGTTNALIAIFCVLLMYWMMRELTDSPMLTGLSTCVFALWHVYGEVFRLLGLALLFLSGLSMTGLLRGGVGKLTVCSTAALCCFFLSGQVVPVNEFGSRIVHWLPGRTASVMTMFVFVALASYARYVRCSSVRVEREPTSLDTPATKSARQSVPQSRAAPWLILSVFALVLALASYEQAVVVPGLMVGVWLLFFLRGQSSAKWPLALFFCVLVAYVLFRMHVLPSEASGYQQQQFRTGPGVWISLGDYLMPGIFAMYLAFQGATLLTVVLFESSLFVALMSLAGNIAAYFRAWNDRDQKWFVFGFLLLAFGAFAPMAWLKPFGHYHYLPSVFRAAFVVSLSTVVLRTVASAMSLPVIQAPRRQDPAPGSLHRP